MKLTYLLSSMLLTSLACSLTIIPTTYAAEQESTPSIQIAAPTKIELETAIFAVKNLPGYQIYAVYDYIDVTADLTPLYREYRYLFNLVRSAEAIVNNFYEQTNPEDLQLLQRSLKDAVTSFTLIYNAQMKKNAPNQTPSTSLSTDTSTSETITPRTATKTLEPTNSIEQTQTTPSSTSIPESSLPISDTDETPAPAETIPEDAAHETPSSPASQTANLMAHAATAGTTFAALGLIAIKGRNKRY